MMNRKSTTPMITRRHPAQLDDPEHVEQPHHGERQRDRAAHVAGAAARQRQVRHRDLGELGREGERRRPRARAAPKTRMSSSPNTA